MTTRIDRTVGNDALVIEDVEDTNEFVMFGLIGGFFSVTVGKSEDNINTNLVDLADAETVLTEMLAAVQARRAERVRENAKALGNISLI